MVSKNNKVKEIKICDNFASAKNGEIRSEENLFHSKSISLYRLKTVF